MTAEVGNTYSGGAAQTATIDPIAVLPVLAAGFAVPQFVPQIRKLHRTDDAAGLSASWALLTGINNAAWFGYFAASRYWFALIPATSAALLGGCLGIMLTRRRPVSPRGWMAIGAWTVVLGAAAAVDRRLLGATLTGAFLIQVIPAVTTAYRTRHPTGIARGTWRLILAEVSCWATFGAAKRDGPLVILGTTGVISALLMLHRARTSGNQPAERGVQRFVLVRSPGAQNTDPTRERRRHIEDGLAGGDQLLGEQIGRARRGPPAETDRVRPAR